MMAESGHNPAAFMRDNGDSKEETMMEKHWWVEVVEDATGNVVSRSGNWNSERWAEKVADGYSLNLNHDKYSVRIRSNFEGGVFADAQQ